MSELLALTNREFKLPADGWYHIASLGDFPHKQSGLVQVLDATAIAAMVNRFNADKERAGEKFPGVLIDQDHFSLDTDKPTTAYGWIQELSNRADGLWAQIKWTDVGEAAVKGGSYRFLSPVWNREDCEDLGNDRVRPMRIRNAAVTNDPNLKGLTPMSNRDGCDAKEKQNMKNIAAKLGMANSDQADEKSVLEQIDALLAKIKSYEMKEDNEAKLTNRVKELETAALGALVEKDLVEFAGVIVNRDEAKAQLMANRDGTLKAWRALKVAALPNRGDGQQPANDGAHSDGKTADEVKAEAIRNRADEIARDNPKKPYSECFTMAQREQNTAAGKKQ